MSRNIAGTTSGSDVKLDNMLLAAYANEVLLTAQPNLVYTQIAQRRVELTVQPGDTITFLKYAPLSGKSEIAETATISTDAMSTSTVSISVTEHAKAVAMSERLIRTAIDDVMGRAATALGRHYALDMNRMLKDTLRSLTSTIYAGDAANRAALTGAKTLDLETIKDAIETLATNKVPSFSGGGGGYYVAFASPHSIRRLKDNAGTDWVNVRDYADENLPGGAALVGEVGRVENIRFIQTTMAEYIPSTTQNIYSDGADTGDDSAVAANSATDVHFTTIVGDYALALAEALPVELRDNGLVDFGRNRAIAYYGIWGSGLIEASHGLIIESA